MQTVWLNVQYVHNMCTIASENAQDQSIRQARRNRIATRSHVVGITWLQPRGLHSILVCLEHSCIIKWPKKVAVHYCKKKCLTRYHEQRSPGASMSYRRVISDEIAFAVYQQDS